MTDFLKAATFLLLDLLSSLVFAGTFALTHNIFIATGVGVVIGLVQVVWEIARGKKPDAMQWMSLGLVVLFGGVTLVTHNAIFIKVKPALIYLVVGAFMCVPGWMNRYMPDIVKENAPEIPFAFGFLWAGLMFLTAAATVVVAFRYDDKTYAAFLASVPLGSKLALFGVQYLATRFLVRRKMIAKAAAEAQMAGAAGGQSPALG